MPPAEPIAGKIVSSYWRPLTDATLLTTSAVYAVLAKAAISAGLFGIWLGMLVMLSLWQYAYTVLRAVAQGRTVISPPSIETMNPVQKPLLMVHFVAFPALITLIMQNTPQGTETAGRLPGMLLILAVLAVFPASTALMSVTANLAAAFNPRAIAEVMRLLGRDYVFLVGACLGIGVFTRLLQLYLLPSFGMLSDVLVIMAGIWMVLGVFALIGSSLHAHRDDFDIPGIRKTAEEHRLSERAKDWQSVLDRAYVSIRSGLVAHGYRTLEQLIAENDHSLDVQYWIFENMLDWEDPRHALGMATRLIERLISEGNLPNAFDLYQRCRRFDDALVLPASLSQPLAEYASEIGKPGIASELIAGPD